MKRIQNRLLYAKAKPTERTDDLFVLTPEMRQKIIALLERYSEEVDLTDLSEASKAHYQDFARCFVRWIFGQFQPGTQVHGTSKTQWSKPSKANLDEK